MSIPDKPLVLVFGATGGIGNALVRELIRDPMIVRVRAAVRRRDAADSLKRCGVESVLLDLSETERLPLTRNAPLLDVLDGVDRLFLLTGYTVDMLAQSKAVLDAAKLAGVKHVVHLGAWGTDDTTITHLGWHQFIERYIEWTGLPFTHLPKWSGSRFAMSLALLTSGWRLHSRTGWNRPTPGAFTTSSFELPAAH